MTVSAISLLIALSALPQDRALTIGDPAPKLVYGDTIKGMPVQDFRGKRPVVVEFWATWCGPCIDSMPHLSELARKFGDKVDFLAVSVWEQDQSKVSPFVEKMGDKMAFPVVLDKAAEGQDGPMAAAWLKAAGQNGIPCTFLIDETGKIAWIGHPQNLSDPLEKVLAGTWDAAAYKTKFELTSLNNRETQQFLSSFYEIAHNSPAEGRFAEVLDWVQKHRADYKGTSVPKALTLIDELFTALLKSDYAAAKSLSDSVKDPLIFGYFRPVWIQSQFVALQGLGEKQAWKDQANKWIAEVMDPNILLAIADGITSPKSKLPDRDPDIALKAAKKLTGMGRPPEFLLSLAWAYHHSGDSAKAIETVDEAIKAASSKTGSPEEKEALLKKLSGARDTFAGDQN